MVFIYFFGMKRFALFGLRLKVPLGNGTFQDTAAAFFNNLPGNLKNCDFKLIYLPLVFLKIVKEAGTVQHILFALCILFIR